MQAADARTPGGDPGCRCASQPLQQLYASAMYSFRNWLFSFSPRDEKLILRRVFFPRKTDPKTGPQNDPQIQAFFSFSYSFKKTSPFFDPNFRAARFADFTTNRNRFFMLFSLLRVMPFSSLHFSLPLLDSVVEPFHEALCSLTARATWQCAALQHTYLIHSSSSADDGSQDLCQQQDLSFVAFPPRALSSR